MEFTGKERDKHSTFDYTYFGARYYDADLGVFTTVDPMAGLYPNTSPFAYCKNDPVNYIDPDGRLVDVIADIAFIAYDVGDILYSAYKGEEVSATQYAALTADVACAFVPIATGGGIAVRAAAKADDALKVGAKLVDNLAGSADNVASAANKADDVSDVQAATRRGRESEARVLKEEGLSKNTKKVGTPEGKSVPDAINDDAIIEVKDTKRVSNTSQLKIQREASKVAEKKHVVITGEKTHVSKTVDKKGTIIKRRTDIGLQPE